MSMLGLCNLRCTVRRLDPSAQDADAGLDAPNAYGGVVASGVWCLAQRTGVDGRDDEAGRVTADAAWLVGIPPEYPVDSWGLKPRDRIDLLAADGAAVARSLFLLAPVDGGGRGQSWQLPCQERL